MRYKVNIKFKDDFELRTYEADGYTTTGGVLQLFTYDSIRCTTGIKVFPLANIVEINLEVLSV